MKQIDVNGRVHIPRIMLDKLGLKVGDSVSVELVNDSIVITNPDRKDKKEELKKYLYKQLKKPICCIDFEKINELINNI